MELNTKPSTTSNGVMLGFFFVMFRGFFEDKTACVPFAFLCHIDTLPSVRRGNCAFSGCKSFDYLIYPYYPAYIS